MQPIKNQNKIAVVTGASRGIGRATALELAKQGYHIIAIARTIGGLEELDDDIQKIGGTATLVPLDITDTPKLQALGPNLSSRFDSIDLIIGAAAYLHKLTSVAQGPLDTWSRSIATNATANINLIQTLHPLLNRSANPKAVFLTMNEKTIGQPYWGFYGASKAALNAFVQSYAAENKNIFATTFTPASTRTRLRDEAFPGITDGNTPEQTAKDILDFLQIKQTQAA